MSKKFTYAFYCGCLSAAIVIILFRFNSFEGLELKTLDIRFRALSKPETASKDVVFAVIDEKSLQAFETQNMPWPWPRSVYAELVGYLKSHGAKAIIFDVLFPTKDIYSTYFGEEENDRRFVDSIKAANNVLLAIQLNEEAKKQNFPFSFKRRFSFLRSDTTTPFFSTAIVPPPEYQGAALALGAVNFTADKDDICRRLPLLYNFNNLEIIPHLGFAAYLMMQENTGYQKEKNKIVLQNTEIPLDNKGDFLLWWYGKGGPEECFHYYPVSSILYSAIAEHKGETPTLPQATFQGKYVIVGTNAPGLLDFRPTPFTQQEKYPGMEIYATMLSNMLQKDFLKRANALLIIAIIIIFCFSVSFSMFYFSKVYYTFFITVGLTALWIGITALFFVQEKIWLDIVAPLNAFAFALTLSASWSYSFEGKARRHLRGTFHRYLDSSIVRQLESNPSEVSLGGVEVEATIFFSDIKNFTGISERLQPREVVFHLNEYFTVCVNILQKHHAFLDKYLGDGLMAMFGIPIPKEDDALRACIASLELQEAIKEEVNGHPVLQFKSCRIGLHAGTMVVGNIGSPKRMEYTAIGDNVNIASRLEGANKVYGTSITMSESVFNKVRKDVVSRELDIIMLKGKATPTRLYELVGINGAVPQETIVLVEQFHKGLALYRARSFEEAKHIFTALIDQFPADEPSKIYGERCRRYLSTPPPADWNGVHDWETK